MTKEFSWWAYSPNTITINWITYIKEEQLVNSEKAADKRISELERENYELKERIAEYDDLTEELDYRKREAKRLWWNNMNNKQEIHF